MYNFRDTTQGTETASFLPSEAVSIAGVFLDQVIPGYHTLWVSGREPLDMDYDSERIVNTFELTDHYQNVRILKIGYQIIAKTATELANIQNTLNGYLNFKDSRIAFNDEPDKYFIGTKSTTEAPPSGVLAYQSTFDIVCVDPHKYSTVTKQFPASLNADGILEATVINDGTESALVDYDIHFNHECGYVGIVSEYGAIQLGKVDEMDTTTGKKSEWLVNANGYADLNAWTTNAGYVPFKPADFKIGGAWKSGTNNGQTYLNWSSIGTGTAYHGTTKQLILPTDSDGDAGLNANWAVQFKPWFANSQVEGGGVMSLILANADGTKRTGIMIHKDQRYNNTFKMIVFDGSLAQSGAAMTRFTSKYFNLAEANNKFTAWKSGMFELIKQGKKLTIKFPDGGTHTVNSSDDTVKYTNLTIMSGGHGTSTPVKQMGWVYVKVRKDHVAYSKDVPNRFADKTELHIDGSSAKVYENEKPITHVLGSTFFRVPPGETKVQFFYSDFSDPRPDAVVSIREAHL